MKDDGGYYNGKWHSPAFLEYAQALESAGPRLKELILHRLEQEEDISFEEFLELCRVAYPEE